MKIVSDTGPLIGLAKIDCLSILKNIATEVLIPPMVHRELLGKVGIESEKIDNALNDFIHITDLKPLDLTTKEALADLDEGEGQAIGLAFTFSEDVRLLIDDHVGREVEYTHNGIDWDSIAGKRKRDFGKNRFSY